MPEIDEPKAEAKGAKNAKAPVFDRPDAEAHLDTPSRVTRTSTFHGVDPHVVSAAAKNEVVLALDGFTDSFEVPGVGTVTRAGVAFPKASAELILKAAEANGVSMIEVKG